MRARLLLLVALVTEEDLDEADLETFVKDSAALARARGVARQGEPRNV